MNIGENSRSLGFPRKGLTRVSRRRSAKGEYMTNIFAPKKVQLCTENSAFFQGKFTPKLLPKGCPEGTFPYFRVAISALKVIYLRERAVAHNSKVAGSNQAPATSFGLQPHKSNPTETGRKGARFAF